jgi:hypothetical protein
LLLVSACCSGGQWLDGYLAQFASGFFWGDHSQDAAVSSGRW